MNLFYLVPIASLVALSFAYYFFRNMMKESEGTESNEEDCIVCT